MSSSSRWRLYTSAESPRAALAAARSLVAGLLVPGAVELGVAPWFRGGFVVEFALAHAGGPARVLEALEQALERTCARWRRTSDADDAIRLWSDALNIPRAEALEVILLDEGPA